MKRRRRTILISLALVLLLLVVVPATLVVRAVRQEQRDQALVAAVKRYDEQAALALLAQGATPNAHEISTQPKSLWQRLRDLFFQRHSAAQPLNTKTLLLLAMNADHVSPRLVLALIKAGANPNVYDNNLGIPLHTACGWASNQDEKRLFSSETVQALLAHGAQVNTYTATHDTPLMTAVYGSPELMQLLINNGANVNATGYNGASVLMDACSDGTKNQLPKAKLLIKRGANVNAVDNTGNSAMEGAVICDDTELADLLLAHGAKINNQDRSGETILYRLRSARMARFLLQHGANAKLTDMRGWTASQFYLNAYRNEERLRRNGLGGVVALLRQAEAKRGK